MGQIFYKRRSRQIIALVCAVISAGFFYGNHEQASWMPSPEAFLRVGWSLAGFAFGAGYLYLALSTYRLEHQISNLPQMQAFITFTRRWFVYLGISICFLMLGTWSLWPAFQKYAAADTIPGHQPPAIQIGVGLLWILGGAGILELRFRMISRNEVAKVVRPSLGSSLLAAGVIAYGTVQLILGFQSLLK